MKATASSAISAGSFGRARHPVRVKPALLPAIACCLCSLGAAPASDPRASILRFAPDVTTAWQVDHPDGDDYLPPERGPRPVTFDPEHPFVPTDPDSGN